MTDKKRWILVGILGIFVILSVSFSILFTKNRTESGPQPIPKRTTYHIVVFGRVDIPESEQLIEGALEALSGQGYESGKNLTLSYVDEKEDVKKILSLNPDIVVTIGGDVTKKVLKETKTLPIVGLGILRFRHDRFFSDYKNVTGTGDMPSVFRQIKLINRLFPVRRLGFLYDRNNENSARQLELLRIVAKGRGMDLYEVVYDTDVLSAGKKCIGHVDAIYIPEEEPLLEHIEDLSAMFLQYNIPILAEDGDAVERGAFLSVVTDYYRSGFIGGLMVSRLLQGKNIPRDIEPSEQRDFDVIVNMAVAKKLGIQLPKDIWQQSKKMYLYDGETARP